MRVISGSAKSLKLKTVEGLDTRPTQDRIKETLFNMIQHEVYDCRFLDLFSGSGAIGIEALSRGARQAVFVEQERRALTCIKDNLSYTHLQSLAKILPMDVLRAIDKLDREGQRFDFIFLDPPYHKGWENKVLSALDQSSICDTDTVVIVESSLDTTIEDQGQYLHVNRVKEYKTNKHTFLRKA